MIMLFRNLFLLMTVIILGIFYYRLTVSRNPISKKYAFFIKIALLMLSFILAFCRQDFIVVGGLAFGGRISVMMLILIEIVDAFIDRKCG